LTSRSRVEIAADILQAARGGAKKTQIAYRTNLNHRYVNKYLGTLIRAGLISREGKLFKTTRNGFEFLQFFEEIKKNLSKTSVIESNLKVKDQKTD